MEVENNEARERAEAARVEHRRSLTGRLQALANAAQLMGMNGWTPQSAELEPPEEWSAGEVIATTPMEDGTTLVYTLRLDPDGERWWHSVEEILTPVQCWADAPLDSIVVDEFAEEWIADRRREKKGVGEKFNRLLREHLADDQLIGWPV